MPDIADRYRLEKVIGRGGMGEVWLAEDTVLHRQVAAKRIGAREPTEDDLRRARQEAKVTAMLDDEHVVRVFDLVPHLGEQWLVMEYVESVNLAQLVRGKGALAPTAAAGFVHQAAQALQAAHRAGIVHRDVKPSNLLVQSSGHVKLGDFGIARLEGEVGVTRTGQLIGSPGYLAPEVASGRSATPASDLWSLGATTWYAVQGRAPYDAGDGNVVGALYRVVNDLPPAAPDAGWLGPLIGHLMVHDPRERWTAAQVTTYLGAALAAGGTPPATPERVVVRGLGGVTSDLGPDPDPAEHTAWGAPVPAARRRSPVNYALVAAGVVCLLLVALIAGLVIRDRGNSSASASDKPSSSASTGPSAAGIETFIRDYLSTAASDPATAFKSLTPAYQRESGGIAGYEGKFWGGVASASASNIVADPGKLTVSYDVAYRMDDGSRRTEAVSLQLAYRDGKYLISGEA